jgi:membrane-associated protease RseP (regulator of RpoE activity)
LFNVIDGTFNLIPLPPLDGFAVINIFLPEAPAVGMREVERTGALSSLRWDWLRRIADGAEHPVAEVQPLSSPPTRMRSGRPTLC